MMPETEEAEEVTDHLTLQDYLHCEDRREIVDAGDFRHLHFTMSKRDVAGAFLQGREYQGLAYVIPTQEICDAMGIPTGSVTKLGNHVMVLWMHL